MGVVKNCLRKYGLEPYSYNIYTQFIEFFGWERSKSIGFLKLADYDDLVNTLIKKVPARVVESWSDQESYDSDEV